MRDTQTIPEMLGFTPPAFDREKPYAAQSYQAQYVLTEEEATDLLSRHKTHAEIDRELGLRFASDLTYRRRVADAMADITFTEPSNEVKAVILRMEKTAKKPDTEGA